MEWVLTRPTVITLAIIGGIFSLVASVIRKRERDGVWATRLDIAAYIVMGVSMLLFIIIGLRGSGT
jgi:predicted membrane channel-forming protein YqfA (hemolysin III family)